jgi:serine/threonine protein kinase
MNIIANKYKIIEKIGSGQFGNIYKGENVRTKELVAIKIELINENKLLKNESKIYQHLRDCKYIPDIKWFGSDAKYSYMVIKLLGSSLKDLITKHSSFSLRLTLKIGIKIIDVLRTIHEKGLVHRDIKPDNFMFDQNNMNNIYLIDFGLCKSYINNNAHISIKKTNSFIGSKNYSSLNAHDCIELSRRDDLESLCYIMFYLINGILPWNNDFDDSSLINKKREIVNDGSQCKILKDILKYVRELTFDEQPKYYLLIDLLKRELSI